MLAKIDFDWGEHKAVAELTDDGQWAVTGLPPESNQRLSEYFNKYANAEKMDEGPSGGSFGAAAVTKVLEVTGGSVTWASPAGTTPEGVVF